MEEQELNNEEIIHTVTEEDIKENGLEGQLEVGDEVILPAVEGVEETSEGLAYTEGVTPEEAEVEGEPLA